MRTHALLPFALATLTAASTGIYLGCSGGDSSALSGTPDASTGDDGGAPPVSTSDAAPPPDDAPAATDAPASGPVPVSFTYAPGWDGVKSVAVLGGFGQTTDWMQPVVTLQADKTGVFRGTAMVPPGQYLYVFKVTGDAQAANPTTYARYAVDPSASAFGACPSTSPTFSMTESNPCSQVSVPQGAPGGAFHVRGTVLVDGNAAGGYLVVLEREETMSHHFFVNRMTTAADGAFDLAAAPGQYRLQVLHPTYLSQTDAERDPVALQALRRTISTSFPLNADVTVPSPELGFHAYGDFAPRDAGTLPTEFTWGDGGRAARLDVYGGKSGEIGDPWYASATASVGRGDFDGGFNTKQATEPSVVSGERYFWGIEELEGARMDGGASVTWTAQSMVFPITYP